MIYLDTSAFVKLFVLEEDSETVNQIVTSQEDALPIHFLHELEFFNALALKVFYKEFTKEERDGVIEQYKKYRKGGYCYHPHLDWPSIRETSLSLTEDTLEHGCRSLDIFHVAIAINLKPSLFVTFDQKQKPLAERHGLSTNSAENTG